MNPSRSHHPNQQPEPDSSSWNHSQLLGVNKLSKPVRKGSSLPPPPPPPVHPQPHVYNVGRNEFRDFVQRLTGASSSAPITPPPTNPHAPLSQPHQRPYNQPSERLQKIRPPPLSSVMHPPPLDLPSPQNPNQIQNSASPLTAYMQYLESSLLGTSRHEPPAQSGGLVPPSVSQPPAAPVVASPPPPRFPSPAFLPSPTAFVNLISPKGYQYSPPLTRNPALSFNQSPMPSPVLPLSPGFLFPNSPNGILSPSNFFPIQIPIWRNS